MPHPGSTLLCDLASPPALAPAAAVVRERVYDIKKAVTVTEGEPEEMEVS
jgi:hypothetical protein